MQGTDDEVFTSLNRDKVLAAVFLQWENEEESKKYDFQCITDIMANAQFFFFFYFSHDPQWRSDPQRWFRFLHKTLTSQFGELIAVVST